MPNVDFSDKVYFMRHKFCFASPTTRQNYLKRGIVAVHYEDRGWNWKNYKEKIAQDTIKRLNELGDAGGWLIADFSSDNPRDRLNSSKLLLIGKVVRKSQEIRTNPEECNDFQNRSHVGYHKRHHNYKTLRLSQPTLLSSLDYGLLTLPFGQGTFQRTTIKTENAKRMHAKKRLVDHVDSLSPKPA